MHTTASKHPAHQFETLEQQKAAATLGMWAFLLTEIMFFGGLFTGYAVYRHNYPEVFLEASRHLNVFWGAFNTVVLIGSSLTMALAVHAGHQGKRKALIAFLLATIFLGTLFLGVKSMEYHHKWVEHLIPNQSFQYEGLNAEKAKLFFGFYFVMTGTHAVHMIVGIGLLSVLVVRAWRGHFSREYSNPVEMTGLYWHFVDLIWIYLFPLLYLIGLH